MSTPFPLSHTVTRTRRTLSPDPDELGNEQWVDSAEQVLVAGWATPTSDEPVVAGHDRLTVDVRIYALPGDFQDGDAVTIDPYGQLEVIGHPENYSHSPFGWDPGLVVVNTRRTDR